MPQLIPFYFLNQVVFNFLFIVLIVYIFCMYIMPWKTLMLRTRNQLIWCGIHTSVIFKSIIIKFLQGNFSTWAFFFNLTHTLIIRSIFNLVLIYLQPYLIILYQNILLLAAFIKSLGYVNGIFFVFHIVYFFFKSVFILLLFFSWIFCYFCGDADFFISILFFSGILYIFTGICSLYISVILLENAFKAYLKNNVFLLTLYLILSFFFFLIAVLLIPKGWILLCEIPWCKYGLIPLPTENIGTGPNGNGNGNPNPNAIFTGTETPEERRKRIYILRRRSLFYHLKKYEKAKEKIEPELRRAQARRCYHRNNTGPIGQKHRQEAERLTDIKDTINLRITMLNKWITVHREKGP